MGKTIADGYIELRIDDSKLDADTTAKVKKVTNTFSSRLNKELSSLNLDPIDIQADPRSALRDIEHTKEKLRELSRTAPTVEIKIRTDRTLAGLDAFTKKFADFGPPAAIGFAAKLSKTIDPLIAGLPLGGPMGLAVIGAGVAVAPLLSSILAGAVIGGAGIGGVVGGLAVAAQDSRVQDSFASMGDILSLRLKGAAGVFVPVALRGIDRIDAAINTIDVERIFADSARFVDPLAENIGNSITRFGDALEKLVAAAGPVVSVIGQGIEQVSTELSRGLESLADNGQQAADALRITFDIVSLGVRSTLQLVNVLTELYDINRKIGGDLGLRLILKLTGSEMDKTADSARRTGSGTFGMAKSMDIASGSAERLKERQADLKLKQDAVTAAQKQLSATLDELSGKNSRAAMTGNALKTVYQGLTGALVGQTEATETYEASLDGLTGAVKDNAKEFKHGQNNLSAHTTAGRANRDALEQLITSNNDLYFADIEAGKGIAYATEKHQKRTDQIRKEARQSGLNKTATEQLIETYGKIPGRKTTDVVVTGVDNVRAALNKLLIQQEALKTGTSVSAAKSAFRKNNANAFDRGGWTGPGGTMQPAGVVHADEFVIKKDSRQKIERKVPGLLDEMNATGQIPGYAGGGAVWPFPVTASQTRIPPLSEVRAAVAPVFGSWPSSPGAQRGDSGIWRSVVRLIKSGPHSGSFGNAYRPGDPLWHGSGRAVDWMGFNQDALASFLASKRPLELIHRTARRDYAYTRGKNKGSFNEGLMQAHRNHIHIAMDDGGYRILQPGMNIIPNNTGRPELIGGPAALAASAAGGGMDISELVAELRAVRQAVEQNGDVVGRHVRRGIGGVDASLGMAADLYSRTS